VRYLFIFGRILPKDDTTAPTVTVTHDPLTPARGQWAVTNVWGHVRINIEFSEPVTGFDKSDLEFENGKVVNIFANANDRSYRANWVAHILPNEGWGGRMSIRIPAGAATDSAGLSNTASNTIEVRVSWWPPTDAEEPDRKGEQVVLSCAGSSDPAVWDHGTDRYVVQAQVAYSIETYFSQIGSLEAIHGYRYGEDGRPFFNLFDAMSFTNEDGEQAGYGIAVSGGLESSVHGWSTNIAQGMTGQLTLQVLPGSLLRFAGSAPLAIAGRGWSVAAADASAMEGTDATIDFEVRLNARDDCKAVKVDWATEDGTATAGEDYTASSGTLTFEPGENVKIVSIPVLDDREHDSGESFTLRLSNALGVNIADAEATGTIFNDEEPQDTVPPSVSVQCVNMDMTQERLAELQAEHDERLANAPPGTFVPLPGDSGQVVTEQYSLWWEFQFSELVKEDDDDSTASMAIVGQDEHEYVLAGSAAFPGRLTSDGFRDSVRYGFAPWVSVGNNTASEVSGIVVSVPAGGWQDRGGNPNTASSSSVYLAHNWKVSVADASTADGADETIDFEVSLNARDDCKTVTVDWATEDGTATAGEDYSAASGTLTFGPGETTKTVSVVVLHDTVEGHGETFTVRLSNAVTTWLDTEFATIADAEATGTIVGNDPNTLTARFENVPESHDGSTAFTFELHFDENIALSYRTVRDSMFDVSGAAVTGARRLTQGSNQGWRITVEPSAAGDIVISLPARACGETGAVCTSDGRTLSEGISETVQSEAQSEEPPTAALTARLANVPDSHVGSSAFEFDIHFSEEPHDLSYKTVRDALFDVANGTVNKARRLTRGSNLAFVVTVEPTAQDTIEISVRGTESCDAEHAVCTTDGRMLSAGPSVTVQLADPITMSVADAEVEEGPGATLDFVVSLSRAADDDITVYYKAYDGTATAGADYEAVDSNFVFSPGETEKTVSVVVLDDAHDEDTETVNFWITSVRGLTAQQVVDPYATGTIRNTDPMPRAWIARFGRTVGGQVVDALAGRLDGSPSSHVTVGGRSVDLGAVGPAGQPTVAMADRLHERSAWSSAWDERQETRSMTGREVLLGSSFHLSSGEPGGNGAALTAWGRVATGGFEADVDNVRMDGDVTTGMLGFDAEWDRVLAGVMVSQSTGEGSYVLSEAMGDDRGTVESTLTGAYPYARITMGRRVSAWGLAGTGRGGLTLHQDGQASLETDLSMTMGAVGVKGALVDPAEGSGVGLSVRSDAMWVRTESDRTTGLASAEADVSRLRLILEGERVFGLGDDATLTPTGQVGVRVDGGDAETGAGLELGAGMRYTAGAVSVEGQVRALVAHEESGFEEWGASGALRVSPDPSGRGLKFSLAPVWGNASNGPERLWTARDATALAVGDDVDDGGRLDAEVGYGLSVGRVPGVVTPYAGVSFAGGGGRSWRSGARWAIAPGAALGVEATRAEAGGDDTVEHGLMLRGSIRW